MSLDSFLNGRDTISTKDAHIDLNIDGKIIKLIECNQVTAKLKKTKKDIQTLGTHWKHKKTTSVEGVGKLGGYLVNSNWIKYAIPYTQQGGDLYFTATLTIHDPTSHVGTEVVLLKDVNLDEVPIADFKTDDGVMEWESDFTFEGVSLVQEFDGMPATIDY